MNCVWVLCLVNGTTLTISSQHCQSKICAWSALRLTNSALHEYTSTCVKSLFTVNHVGTRKVAEVRSRFEGQEDGVDRFVDVARRLGFDCRQMDRSNKMFLMAEFKKSKRKSENGVDFEAKVRKKHAKPRVSTLE